MNAMDTGSDDELEGLLRASRRLESAPSHVLERAFAIWQPRRSAQPSVLRRWLAELSFDSLSLLQPAAGLRGFAATSADGQRQLVFTTEVVDVDLRIHALPDGRFQLGGQVLGGAGEIEVELAVGDVTQRCPLDALAAFRFEPVPAGEARISLRLGDGEVELPAFALAR